jgi:hypothetical protein
MDDRGEPVWFDKLTMLILRYEKQGEMTSRPALFQRTKRIIIKPIRHANKSTMMSPTKSTDPHPKNGRP